MKKIISVLLIVIIVCSLGACAKKESPPEENITTLANAEIDNTTTAKDETTTTTETEEENQEKTGIFKISALTVGEYYLFTLLEEDQTSTDDGYKITEVPANLPDKVELFQNVLRMKCTIKDGTFSDWSLIDLLTNENIGQPTDEELENRFTPKNTAAVHKFSVHDAEKPVMQVSTLKEDYIYPFSCHEYSDGCIQISNDTDKYYVFFARNKSCYEITPVPAQTNGKAALVGLEVGFGYIDPKDVFCKEVSKDGLLRIIGENGMHRVSKNDVMDNFDNQHANYIYNDTNKPAKVTWSANDNEYIIQPGEIYYSYWQHGLQRFQPAA